MAKNWYDIYRARSGDPEHDESDHVGVVQADSIVEAVSIASHKVACQPPAILWACEGDVDDQSDVIRLNDLEDRPQSRAGK